MSDKPKPSGEAQDNAVGILKQHIRENGLGCTDNHHLRASFNIWQALNSGVATLPVTGGGGAAGVTAPKTAQSPPTEQFKPLRDGGFEALEGNTLGMPAGQRFVPYQEPEAEAATPSSEAFAADEIVMHDDGNFEAVAANSLGLETGVIYGAIGKYGDDPASYQYVPGEKDADRQETYDNADHDEHPNDSMSDEEYAKLVKGMNADDQRAEMARLSLSLDEALADNATTRVACLVGWNQIGRHEE